MGAYSRKFSPLGSPLEDEFRVNDQLSGAQRQPDIAYAADGSFLVTWSSQDTSVEPERTDAMARAFDPDGHPRSTEFPLSSLPEGSTSGATTTALDDGGFVVVWSSPARMFQSMVTGTYSANVSMPKATVSVRSSASIRL